MTTGQASGSVPPARPAKSWARSTVAGIAAPISNAVVGGPFGSDLVSRDYVEAGVPVIRGQNLGTRYVGGEFVFVTSAKAAALSCNLARPGDLVFSQRGTVGQVSIVPAGPYDRYLVSQSQMKLTVDESTGDPRFYYYVFSSEQYQRTIRDSTIQTGVPHINLGILRALEVPRPEKVEQSAIAEALSDADALIESLEQLLVKKREIKQGAVQELLTGRKRLPGFDKNWVTRRLGDLANIRSGGTPSTSEASFWDGEIPWCTPTDVTRLQGKKYLDDTNRRISSLGLKSSSAELIPAGSVVMTSRATIGECAINRIPVTTNQGFKNFVPSNEVDTEFLYYLLGAQKARFISLCGGSTFLEIGKRQLVAFEILVPNTRSEQSAISEVLKEMDEELAILGEKVEKARQVKHGMMQELLTGRARLR